MLARTVVGMSLVAGIIGTIGFVACGEGPRPKAPAAARASVDGVSSAIPAPLSSTAAPAPSGDPTLAAAHAARSCSAPTVALVNHPDGGVVFNNAMTSADAGFIDRTEGSVAALAAKAAEFRCCLSAWGSAHEGEQQVMLQVELAPNGTVSSSRIDPARSDVDDATSRRCVELVARDADFPQSPTGKQTWVEYPLRFKALP